MGKFVIESLVKKLIAVDISVRNAKVTILDFIFKEDCPDTRNTKVINIINELAEYGIIPQIVDPVADSYKSKHEYGLDFDSITDIIDVDVVIIAVNHSLFRIINKYIIDKLYNPKNEIKIFMEMIMSIGDYKVL